MSDEDFYAEVSGAPLSFRFMILEILNVLIASNAPRQAIAHFGRWRMSASVIFTVLLVVVSGCSHLQPVHQDAATIEFDRPEDNGSVNILPCTLVISDRQRVTLIGGQHATVAIPPGKLWVEAFSSDPYSLHSSAEAWRSTRITFHIGSGERIQFCIEPRAEGSTYIGGWIIHHAQPVAGADVRCGLSRER